MARGNGPRIEANRLARTQPFSTTNGGSTGRTGGCSRKSPGLPGSFATGSRPGRPINGLAPRPPTC